MNIAHKDPFDRLLIAPARAEDMVLVSNEALLKPGVSQNYTFAGRRSSDIGTN